MRCPKERRRSRFPATLAAAAAAVIFATDGAGNDTRPARAQTPAAAETPKAPAPAPPARLPSLTGTFRTHANFPSRFLAKGRDVLVYLPPGYDAPGNRARRYPVLYLHDGQNVFDGATSFLPNREWRVDETAQALIEEKAIEPLLIVAVYNAGADRNDEYTPTRGERFGGKADAYGRMLVEELKPFIDRTYRTRKDAANTGLGGSSFGGLVSLYLGLKYPDVFGKLAVVSPSVWWDSRFPLRQVAALAAHPPLRIWMDMGTGEGERSVADARALRDALVAKGWTPGKDLSYLEAPGAEHNEDAWARRVEPMLRFLFPEARR